MTDFILNDLYYILALLLATLMSFGLGLVIGVIWIGLL
jgi:ABC-type polysaccharide/polyol phosphate export permease